MTENPNKLEANPAPAVLLLAIETVLVCLFLNPYWIGLMFPDLSSGHPRLWIAYLCGCLLVGGLALAVVWRWRALGKTAAAQIIFQRHARLGGILLSVGAITVFLSFVEVASWRLNVWKQAHGTTNTRSEFTPDLWSGDPVLGWRGRLNKVVNHRCLESPGDAVIFDKNYTFDGDRFRVVPAPEGPKNAHLAVFGCSYSFGIGCNDDETLPARLAAARPDVEVHNYAMPAFGPAQALLLLQEDCIKNIGPKPGAAVFLFIYDHLFRLAPKMSKMQWEANFPAFELDPAGEPRLLGPFSEVYPKTLRFYRLLSKEQFVQLAGIDLPFTPSDEFFDLCAGILAKARETYRARFPENEFYVVMDPICYIDFDHVAMVDRLRNRGVPVVEASGVYGADAWAFHYPRDKHPMPEANEIFAKWLWTQLPLAKLGDGAKSAPSGSGNSSE